MFKSRKEFGNSSDMLFRDMCSPDKEFRSLNALFSIRSIPHCCRYLKRERSRYSREKSMKLMHNEGTEVYNPRRYI